MNENVTGKLKILSLLLVVILVVGAFAYLFTHTAVQFPEAQAKLDTLNVVVQPEDVKLAPKQVQDFYAYALNGTAPYSFYWEHQLWYSDTEHTNRTFFSSSNSSAFAFKNVTKYAILYCTVTDAEGSVGYDSVVVYDPQAFTISSGVYPGGVTTVYLEDGTCYAKNPYGVMITSGTDALTVIQAAINALPYSGATIFIKASSSPYVIDGSIQDNPTYMPFTLESDGAILEKAVDAGTEYLTVQWMFDIGNVQTNAEKYPYQIRGFKFTVAEGNDGVSNPAGVFMFGLSAEQTPVLDTYASVIIEDCSFYNTYGSVQLIFSDYALIRNCYFDNVGAAFSLIGGSKKNTYITQNVINSTDTGALLASGYPSIEDFHFTENYMHGGFVLVDLNFQGNLHRVWISDNTHFPTTDDINSHQSVLLYANSDDTNITDVIIENNVFDGSLSPIAGSSGGITIYSRAGLTNLMDKLVIRGNTLKNYAIAGSRGIYVEALKFEVGGVLIENNDLSDNNNVAMTVINPERAIINDNRGFITENSGTATNATATTFSITHGLAGTPTGVWASFNTTAINGWMWASTSSTITITVTGTSLPESMTAYWKAE